MNSERLLLTDVSAHVRDPPEVNSSEKFQLEERHQKRSAGCVRHRCQAVLLRGTRVRTALTGSQGVSSRRIRFLASGMEIRRGMFGAQ